MFKFKLGQTVWYVDGRGRAASSEISERSIEENEWTKVISYQLCSGIGSTPECKLFGSAHDLVADLLFESGATYKIEIPDSVTIQKRAELSDLCGSFIDDNALTSKKTILVRKGLKEKALKLIEEIAELIGYYEGAREE